MSVSETVDLYGEAWNEPDEASRRKLLDRSWSDDGVYLDPTARVAGREALVKHIGEAQARFPGSRIDLTSGVDEHDGYFRISWAMRNADGSTAIEGMDFGSLAEDGRIVSITGFFGPFPPLESTPAG